MIVSTWQIFPKRSFVAVEPRLRCKRRQTRRPVRVWQAKAWRNSQSSRPDYVQVQRVISETSDRGYHETGHF
jgi:hypothetical protein